MKTQQLTDVLERIENWPAEAQNELAAFARDLEAGINEAPYQASAEELAGIDRGLAAAARGDFATNDEVEAVFAKFGKQ